MGMIGFIVWFCTGLIGTMLLQIMFKNAFIVSFIVAMLLGFLGAKE